MRKIMRGIARANMRKAGVQHINKRKTVIDRNGMPMTISSFFALNWRNYV